MIEKSVKTAVAVALILLSPAAGAEDSQAAGAGCVLQSIELDDQGSATLLRLRTEGEPSSIGARVEEDVGVVLDLSGCALGQELAGREFADGLVSALRIIHGSAAQGTPLAVVIEVRGAFEYSVSTEPGTVLVRLRAAAAGTAAAGMNAGMPDAATPDYGPARKVRVLEPLPIEPAPPLAELPAPSPASLPSPSASLPPLDTSQVTAAVEDWAQAWSDQRAEEYLSAYASGFQPPEGLDRPAWEALRRLRVVRPRWIEVILDELEVRVVGPDRALAAFLQRYSSDTFSDQVEKTLTLVEETGRWRILREEVGLAEAPDASRLPPFLEAPAPEVAPAKPDSGESSPAAAKLVEGARISVDKAPSYDATYQFLTYPGGDPGWERGAGPDVIIRAYRHLGIDLQERIHQDVLAAGPDYGIETPDTHIDHRRVRNLITFLRRHGRELGLDRAADWRPGDIVFWRVEHKRRADHTGIVSDRRGPDGQLLVIHHQDGGPPREEDVLFAWPVRGHFRWGQETVP